MQATKSRNGYIFTPRADKHMFIPPGALSKGRAQGSRSFHSFGSSSQSALLDTINNVTPPIDTPIMQSNDISVPLNLEPMEELREADTSSAQKKRKVRGKNKCRKVTKLKSGQKLKVKFYNNRAVGKNHRAFSRHLGRIVRDCNICPLRVHSWKEIDNEQKKHMWAAVTDKFEHEKMEDYCDETLAHMKDLWNKWRGDLHRKFIKPSKSIQEALKNIPEGVDRGDWEWLVKEHFSSEKFLGGKVGEPPSLATIFFETRKKGDMLVEQETISRYDKIVDVTQAEPSLSNIELVEKCFGPQRHDHVVCYGGGLKPNDMRTSGSKSELQAKLRESQRENQSLKNRMDEMENEVRMIKECFNVNNQVPLHLHQMGNQYDHI